MILRIAFYICIVFSITTFYACDSFKKAQTGTSSKSDIDPITGKKKKKNKKNNSSTGNQNTAVVAKMDTIEWNTSAIENPPIVSDGIDYSDPDPEPTELENENENESTSPDSELYSSYKTSILLPFLSDKFNTNGGRVYEKSKMAINMYAGMEMAFEKLEREGVRLDVTVMDTKGSLSQTQSLLQRSELQNSQLIVGPVRNENIKAIAQFALANQIPMASPVSPSNVISSENPYYLQVSPRLETHCKAITNHILQRYQSDQVVLICRDKTAEKNRLRYFQEANRAFSGGMNVTPFKEYIVSEISADYSNLDIQPYLHPSKKTIFIIPSWSNESFINTILRVIRISKSTRDVMVYGMPKWMEYEKISYDYYEDLNVHVSSDTYINPLSPAIQSFQMDYFNKYGESPNEYAFLGYDLMLYLGRMLREKGSQFQQTIDIVEEQYLHTKFAFKPISKNNLTTGSEDFTVGQYENQYVNILQFKDYYFQAAN